MRRRIERVLLLGALSGATFVASPERVRAQDDDYWVDVGDDSSSSRAPSRGGPSSLDEATRSGQGMRLGQIAPREIPPSYAVRRGDTLWDITGHFYGNPYEWPRVWSYNPEITNPHWIYPDQSVRLLPEGTPTTIAAPTRGSRVVVRRGVETGTVFLREQGWLDEDALETAGEIVGSPDDHMMLSPFDQAYVRFDRLPEGQTAPQGEYTIFRAIEAGQRTPGEEGTLVRILGAVRIDSWDPDRRTARATIIEALDPIERGYQVAALPRRFEVVPPARSEIDLDTEIVAALNPTELVGDQQIVFVPVGEEAGVRIGHRFFLVRAGDQWREELAEAQRQAATVDPPSEPEEYPDEVIAEARVVSLRPHSAGLLVTRATVPIAIGDRAQLRRGY
ncbi:LysM peptidoglycan-binding domain-containing protein [Sandaracinus amylolyticus]|uniref:LysM peptidoglycan-binding domain-containing protein n=1 Tax=Sandaracinus amylolyticus TaxID=927083 RepID=UPI001F42A0B4|nr:LysM peptidoglycan-binding domain-containing protein [Sandaracinus amylolyticus]UJR80074.1 LysM peptidoglycan-binding domain-containing protein [Sandaracinus amylolyticus]